VVSSSRVNSVEDDESHVELVLKGFTTSLMANKIGDKPKIG